MEKGRQQQPRRDQRQGVTRNNGWSKCLLSLMALCALLALPVIALHRQGFLPWQIGAFVFTLSLLTYTVYASDKRRARMNAWRIAEAHLHTLEILGGWPGAWLAQQRLRHKCSKVSYQCIFWLIILVHQFVAYDSLQNWKYSKALMVKTSLPR